MGTLELEPLEKVSLVDLVAERIRGLIEQENLQAGDRLPNEADLMKNLRVSRNVLREAINRLEVIGLVAVRLGRGMFVGNQDSLANCVKLVRSAMGISPKELHKLLEFRGALECKAAFLAASLAKPEDVAELETLCELMDRKGEEYMQAVRHDFQFHLKLLEITGNELMRNVMVVIQEFVIMGMQYTSPTPRDHGISRRVHGAILEAVRKGDPEGAEKAMKAHMDFAAKQLVEATKRRK